MGQNPLIPTHVLSPHDQIFDDITRELRNQGEISEGERIVEMDIKVKAEEHIEIVEYETHSPVG